MKRTILIILCLALLAALGLTLWIWSTIPKDHSVTLEQVALDATDEMVLRREEANRAHLRAAAFRSHTRAWFRNYGAPDYLVDYRSLRAGPMYLGETVLETHWQHWIRGDDFATSATLLDMDIRTSGSLHLLKTQPVLVRTTSDDGFYRTLTKHPYARPSVTWDRNRYRHGNFTYRGLSLINYAQRGDWPDRPVRPLGHFRSQRYMLAHEPSRFSVAWTTVTLDGNDYLRRRFLDAKPLPGHSRLESEVLFDPRKNYEAVRIGPKSNSAGTTTTTHIDVREVATGVWLPVRYETVVVDKTGKVKSRIVSEIDMATASFNRPEDVDGEAFIIEVPPGGEFHDRRYGDVWELVSTGKIFEELWEEVERAGREVKRQWRRIKP